MTPAHVLAPIALGAGGLDAPRLLAEPPARAGEWYPAVYSRILIASSGPVWVEDLERPLDHAHRTRLEEARIPIIAAAADVAEARRAYWPALPRLAAIAAGAGSPAPRLVVLAARESPWRPLLARPGAVLLRALRALGWDELSIYLAAPPDEAAARAIAEALMPGAPAWLALGEAAAALAGAAGIRHIAAPDVASVEAARDRAEREVVAAYTAVLRAAGAPEGAWTKDAMGPLPTAQADDAADLVDDLELPRAISAKLAGPAGRLDPERVEAAHVSYVTGEATSLSDAARRASISPDAIHRLAARQGWEAERDAYREEARRRIYRDAMAAEVKTAKQVRSLAWAGANIALRSVVERMQPHPTTGEVRLLPSITDAAVLAKTAIMLSEMVDPASDLRREELADASWPTLLREVNRVVVEQFGPEVFAALEGGPPAISPPAPENGNGAPPKNGNGA